MSIDEIYKLTKIDPWFLREIEKIINIENKIASLGLEDTNLLWEAKQSGFSDGQLSLLTGKSIPEIGELRQKEGVLPVYKTVDTCAAEFAARTPYHYSSYERPYMYFGDGEPEIIYDSEVVPCDKEKIIILEVGRTG